MQTERYAKVMAVMMSPREKWTDERLDDLNGKVDRGFADLKAEVRDVRAGLKAEMKNGFERLEADSAARFKEVDRRLDEVNGRLERLEDGFFGLNRTLNTGLFVIVATLIGSNFF